MRTTSARSRPHAIADSAPRTSSFSITSSRSSSCQTHPKARRCRVDHAAVGWKRGGRSDVHPSAPRMHRADRSDSLFCPTGLCYGSALALTFFGHDAIVLIGVVDPSKNLHVPAAPAMSEKLGRFGLRHDDFSVFRDSRAAKGVPSIPAQLQANSPPRHSRERITALTCTVNVLSAWSTLLRARTPHLLFRRVAPLSPAGQRSNPD